MLPSTRQINTVEKANAMNTFCMLVWFQNQNQIWKLSF
jgi:hypothetical protein